MQPLLNKLVGYYNQKNRLWLPLAAGAAYALGLPPFNSLLHPAFTLFPLLSFVICLPLFLISLNPSFKRAVWHSYLFGLIASGCQFYWIAFVVPEGLWHLVLIGVALACLYEGLYFLLLGVLFRWSRKKFPTLYVLVFPALWVLVEYVRGLGEISFPWNLIGYSLTPLLPLSQLASVTGVFGLSFVVVLGNVLVWKFVSILRRKGAIDRGLPVFAAALIAVGAWGFVRMKTASPAHAKTMTIAALQSDIDQNHWGANSLDSSFDIVETLVRRAAKDRPDLIIMPESALLCYLIRRPMLADRVASWAKELHVPMIVGALHWDNAPKGSAREYFVYNSAFYLDPNTLTFTPYYKMRLVPFSEALPFQGIFPILSRVNLGQADFKTGNDPVVFSIGPVMRAAPFICYEIIYPDLVRQRVKRGANLLVNITNDGWFGKTSGAFQHATMARMRCIENGVPLARSANTGVTMLVDQFGRVLCRKEIYTRTYLTGKLSIGRIPTLYTRLGDWPVIMSLVVVLAGIGMIVIRRFSKAKA
ncbi:MAG TPA: apolipoprotein N-acyltransferase [Chitinivibrionales bacterium]|nr:apolipoprotein N-acyltransferase [Chitinivibrionales bacterium]